MIFEINYLVREQVFLQN